ncbi:unnamed protein product [Vicia faba]|uniref:Uncharacterized protein n=1 Tax=Vicia faba TaxID=3906 RepID=A0AAV0Z454_VICFA|nr:unnamed protein product [Vicia faba]
MLRRFSEIMANILLFNPEKETLLKYPLKRFGDDWRGQMCTSECWPRSKLFWIEREGAKPRHLQTCLKSGAKSKQRRLVSTSVDRILRITKGEKEAKERQKHPNCSYEVHKPQVLLVVLWTKEIKCGKTAGTNVLVVKGRLWVLGVEIRDMLFLLGVVNVL